MRFGINSFLFTSPFTTESTALFRQFRRWGFDTVEIPIEDPSHIDPAQVRAAADKAGIAIGSVVSFPTASARRRNGSPVGGSILITFAPAFAIRNVA